jgi:hypothetical protein
VNEGWDTNAQTPFESGQMGYAVFDGVGVGLIDFALREEMYLVFKMNL